MHPDVRSSMLTYYDERADEYDAVYVDGLPGKTSLCQAERLADVEALFETVRARCRGTIVDVPCGTAFWLPAYAALADRVTLVDQSPRMLAHARAKARSAGVSDRCSFLQADAFEGDWAFGARCDTVLSAFFLSHVEPAEEARFFGHLRSLLGTEGTLVVLDSAWHNERERPRAGVVRRRLSDGREFEIYKRHFDRCAIERLAADHGLRVELRHMGRLYFAFTGSFSQ